MKTVDLQYDVVVVGGGTAGTAAAMAAAEGNRVLIVERGYALGGAATLGQVSPRMSTKTHGFQVKSMAIIDDKVKSIHEKYQKDHYMNAVLLQVALEALMEERKVTVLYGATLTAAHAAGNTVTDISAMAGDTLYHIKAASFIDATGDALLASLLQLPLACGDENGKNQNMTLRFHVANVDIKSLCRFLREKHALYEYGESRTFAFLWTYRDCQLTEIFKAAVDAGEITYEDAVYIQAFLSPSYGDSSVYFNCPEAPAYNHSTDAFDISKAIIYCRSSTMRLWRFFQKHFPGFEESYIVSFADYPGIRDGNRLVGRYVLTEEDCFSSKKFEDGIAECAYPLDVHGASKLLVVNHKIGDRYEVPYRALIPQNIDNMLVVGRCISATFLAQSSIRIQIICMATGEAAGLATVIARETNTPLAAVDGRAVRARMKAYGTVFIRET